MNGFPYPVLLENESSYKNEYIFEIEYKNHKYNKDELELILKMNLTSKTLKKKIENNEAFIFVKLVSAVFSKNYNIGQYIEEINISVPLDKILSNDKIEITAYILSNDETMLNWSDELVDNYPKIRRKMRKNDILAISNKELLDYNLENNFIKFSEVPEQEGKGIRIDLNGQNYVSIQIGHKFNEAYAIIKKEASIRDVINSHLLFEAFVYIVFDIIQKPDEYIEKPWYKVLDSTFEYEGRTLDEFKKIVKDEEVIDIEAVYEAAQQLINNQLERSIITASERSIIDE